MSKNTKSKATNPSERRPPNKHAFGATGATPSSQLQGIKKIHPDFLPVISNNSGPSIIQIREALTTYCQREIGPISKIFTSGKYDPPKPIEIDYAELSIANDTTGMRKQLVLNQHRTRELEIDSYQSSKLKLFGIITSMMTKDLDEKVKAYIANLPSAQPTPTTLFTNTPNASEPAIIPDLSECPLFLWNCILVVLTTKTSGNLRIDQDNVAFNFCTLRQRQLESINDFLLRVDNIVNTYKILGLEPPSKEQQAMRFIQGLEHARFSSLQTHLANELNMPHGRDLYPSDLDSAAAQASRWLIAGTKGPQDVHTSFALLSKEKAKLKKPSPKVPIDTKTNQKKCIFCHNVGHTVLECNKLKAAQATAAASSLTVPHPTIPPQDPYKEKRTPLPRKGTALVSNYRDDNDDEESLDNFMLSGVHIAQPQSTILATGGASSLRRNQLLLDTGANTSVVHNARLLTSIRPTRTVRFDGLAGVLPISQIGDLDQLCSAYYSPHAVANIISFSQLRENGHTITYDSGFGPTTDSFTVRTPRTMYVFSMRPNGLYVCDIDDHRTVAVTTIAENESRFTRREVLQARAARDLSRRMGHPPDSKLIRAIQLGTLHGCLVSPADINRATTIYGPSVAALRGRTTTQRPHPFPTQVPRDRAVAPQSMFVDLFKANSIDFLITYVRPLNHLLVTAASKTDLPTLRRILRTHLGTYGQRRITVEHIYSDNEKGITAMAPDFAGAGITLHQSGPGMHIHVIERQIRMVKEGVRTGLSALPFTCCDLLFKYLVGFTVTRANMFPNTTTMDNLSPFQILYNRPVNANRDAHLEFGALYEVTSRTGDNSMAPRTIGAIGLAQTPNGTGTCQFLNLGSWTLFSANHFKQVPMTPDVISLLNSYADKDKRPPSIHPIFSYRGLPLPDGPIEDIDVPLPVPIEQNFIPYVRTDVPTQDDPVTYVPHAATGPDTFTPPEPILDSHVNVLSGAPIRADSLSTPSYANVTRGEPDTRTHPAEYPTLEPEADDPDMPDLVDEEEDIPLPKTPAARSPQVAQPYVHPQRDRRPPDRLNLTLLSSFHVTARKAIKENRAEAVPAIEAELRSLLHKKAFHGIHVSSLTETQRKGIINSTMNITQKFSPSSDGNGRVKDKLKARLVGGGNRQDRSSYSREEISSPTVSTTSVLLLSQLAAAEKREVISLDIGCAYLNASMPKSNPDKAVYMRISPEIATFLIKIDPAMQPYLMKNGCITVELDQALYGCIESAVLWYQELSTTLREQGYQPNPLDPCVFNSTRTYSQVTIAVYVDDLLITGNDSTAMESLIDALRDRYKDLKIVRGKVHNYLGMVLNFTRPAHVTVSQAGMILDITRGKPLDAVIPHTSGAKHSPSKTPAPGHLFEVSPDSLLLSPIDKAIVHRTAAQLLFVGTHSRPDIVLANSFHTKRVLSPTLEDSRKLERTLSYLENTANLALTLQCHLPPRVYTFIDAAHAVHPDMKGHTGVCVTLGTGMLYSKSTSQKINTTSSCQSELVALAKGLQQSIWIRSFLIGQGYPKMPISVYQDNTSTIKLVENGRSTSELSRHISIGYFWIHDLIKRGVITVEYCPTEDMVADFFTKPLQGSLFLKLRNLVMGETETINKK